MREEVTPRRLDLLMDELARVAPRPGSYRVYLVGGGTAVYVGWRASSIDVDLHSEDDVVFRDIQAIKERLKMNIEFVRPEDFVPSLEGSMSRHVLIKTIGPVSFYHYDPYSQCFAKVVRGFQRDIEDAHAFIVREMVNREELRSLVAAIPDSAYAKYPNLSKAGVENAIEDFLASMRS